MYEVDRGELPVEDRQLTSIEMQGRFRPPLLGEVTKPLGSRLQRHAAIQDAIRSTAYTVNSRLPRSEATAYALKALSDAMHWATVALMNEKFGG